MVFINFDWKFKIFFIIAYFLTNQDGAPKVILAIEYKKGPEVQEKQIPSPPPSEPEPEPVKVEAPVAEAPPDLLVTFRISINFSFVSN